MSLDLDTKRNRWQMAGMIAGFGLIGFLVAPFVFLAIKGIIGLLITGAIALAAIQFLPYFGLLIANWRLKAIKYEASQNPIETLENDFMERANGLRVYRDSLRNFKGEIGTFESKFDEFKEKYPTNTAGIAKFQDQLDKMNALFDMRGKKYMQAKDNLANYKDQIDRARGEWEMAQAAAQMNKAAGVDADQFLRNIQVDTAFDSVQKGLNSAFADLQISFLDEHEGGVKNVTGTVAPVAIEGSSVKALPAPRSLTNLDLDVEVSEEPAREPVAVESAPKRRPRSYQA